MNEFEFTVVFDWPHERDSEASTGLVEELVSVIERHGGNPHVSTIGPHLGEDSK